MIQALRTACQFYKKYSSSFSKWWMHGRVEHILKPLSSGVACGGNNNRTARTTTILMTTMAANGSSGNGENTSKTTTTTTTKRYDKIAACNSSLSCCFVYSVTFLLYICVRAYSICFVLCVCCSYGSSTTEKLNQRK